MTQQNQRTLTSAGVSRTLGKAGIPATGPNRLTVLSPKGNTFIRKDGTAIRIFNVLAFRSIAEQDAAVASWKLGTKLEKSGDIAGAQEHFKAALNQLMSFSVLETNATNYEGVFEVNCIIEEVPAGEELQNQGTMTVLGISYPRPVPIAQNIQHRTDLFVYTEEATPSTAKATKKKKVATAAE